MKQHINQWKIAEIASWIQMIDFDTGIKDIHQGKCKVVLRKLILTTQGFFFNLPILNQKELELKFRTKIYKTGKQINKQKNGRNDLDIPLGNDISLPSNSDNSALDKHPLNIP